MNHDIAVIAVGITLGMAFFQRTGFSPGGIISPGILALRMSSPQAFCWTILLSLAVLVLLEITVRITGVYGRQRTAAALLLAAGLRLISGGIHFPDPEWIGWLIPGLVAADIQRQGALPTSAGLLAVSGVTFLIGGLFS